jgi:hypothetical protein
MNAAWLTFQNEPLPVTASRVALTWYVFVPEGAGLSVKDAASTGFEVSLVNGPSSPLDDR